MVLRPAATFDLATRLRSPEGAALGEVFTFLSGLYFRGKLAYARRFADAPVPGDGLAGVSLDAGRGIFVITTNCGLVPPDTHVNRRTVVAFGKSDIAEAGDSYRRPLLRDAHALSELLGPSGDVVLLGSIASAKYVDVLTEVFGARLLFPADFVGRGDMSRGGLMLRSSRSGEELPYVPVVGATRHGKRPPKLPPIKRRPPAPPLAD
jgi:hypothetical protein